MHREVHIEITKPGGNIIHLGHSNFAIQIIYKDSINRIGSYFITFSILFLEVSNRRVVNTRYFQRTA